MANRGVVGCQIELKMGGGEPGTRGQGKKRRKSAGVFLPDKEKVMKNIRRLSQRPSKLPDNRNEEAVGVSR
jgi:hypothetical protein